MTIENGADPAANDVAPEIQVDVQPETEFEDVDNPEGDEGRAQEPVDVEVDYEGKKYRLPQELKDALLRQSDYTRKTQEVAEGRKSLEGEREAHKASVAAQQAHFKAATKIAALDEQLEPYKDVNWPQLYQQAAQAAAQGDHQFLNNYHQHKANFDQLMLNRNTAVREFSDLERTRQQETERESANRFQKAQAEIASHIPGWTPGNELDQKIASFGTSQGLSVNDMREMAIRMPKAVALLNELRTLKEAAAKAKTQQTFEKQQEARPVTRVGGNGGSAQRKTTDSSGDALSAEEWVKRERERMQKTAGTRVRA